MRRATRAIRSACGWRSLAAMAGWSLGIALVLAAGLRHLVPGLPFDWVRGLAISLLAGGSLLPLAWLFLALPCKVQVDAQRIATYILPCGADGIHVARYAELTGVRVIVRGPRRWLAYQHDGRHYQVGLPNHVDSDHLARLLGARARIAR